MKNNMFKSNSRFAALSESYVNEKKNEPKKNEQKNEKPESILITDDKPKNNTFKVDKQVLYNERPVVYNERPVVYNERPVVYNERPVVYNERPVENNIFSQKVTDKAQKQRKEEELERLMNEKNKALSMDNFPELILLNKKNEPLQKPISFAEKLKQKEKEKVVETSPELMVENIQKPIISFSEKLKVVNVVLETQITQIPYGWAVIKRDKTTNKSSIEYNKQYEDDLKRAEMMEKKIWPMKVLCALVDLYENERDKYINKWGYDAYEEKYLDPDYDDEYFDRLDEEYASETEDEEYDEEADYSEQTNYWKN